MLFITAALSRSLCVEHSSPNYNTQSLLESASIDLPHTYHIPKHLPLPEQPATMDMQGKPIGNSTGGTKVSFPSLGFNK